MIITVCKAEHMVADASPYSNLLFLSFNLSILAINFKDGWSRYNDLSPLNFLHVQLMHITCILDAIYLNLFLQGIFIKEIRYNYSFFVILR